jgi:hypothetical protein
MTERILKAMMAGHIPAAEFGMWSIVKRKFDLAKAAEYLERYERFIPGVTHTFLHHLTGATISIGGDCIMEDTPAELSKHLDFVMRATGDVLVTGLGLGCVVRGLLAVDKIQSITVIERDAGVIEHVGSTFHDSRVEIVHSDAIEYVENNERRFDAAWHDLWSNPDNDEQKLDLTHIDLICKLRHACNCQGAWRMPRHIKRMLSNRLQVLG